MRPHLAAAVLWLACSLFACRSVTPAGMYFQSDPPGAEVIVDGRRSGYVTPCLIDLGEDDTRRVRIELPGFRAREVVLVPSKRMEEVRWRDGALSRDGVRGIFGLGAGDLLVPFRIDRSLSPSRTFVRLVPESGAPGPD